MSGHKAAAAVPPEPLAMWSRGDDKLLEMLLVRYYPRWELIAARLVGKTPEQASQRYERMVEEVTHVLHALQVDTPREWDAQIVVAAAPPERETTVVVAPATAPDVAVASAQQEEAAVAPAPAEKARVPSPSAAAVGEESEHVVPKKRRRVCKRRKTEKWTEEEHNLFLEGLERYGKGKWKAMSSEYLTTKSASQIASHHQKHRNRLEQRKRNGCKRASIHDITEPTSAAVVADGGELAAAQQQRDELARVEPSRDPGEDEAIREGGHVGAVEEFPGEDDLGTLFM